MSRGIYKCPSARLGFHQTRPVRHPPKQKFGELFQDTHTKTWPVKVSFFLIIFGWWSIYYRSGWRPSHRSPPDCDGFLPCAVCVCLMMSAAHKNPPVSNLCAHCRFGKPPGTGPSIQGARFYFFPLVPKRKKGPHHATTLRESLVFVLSGEDRGVAVFHGRKSFDCGGMAGQPKVSQHAAELLDMFSSVTTPLIAV